MELEVECNLTKQKLKNIELKENILEKEHAEMRKVNTDARRKGVPKICNTENFENFNNKINFFKNLQRSTSASTSQGETNFNGQGPPPKFTNESDSISLKKSSDKFGPMGDEIRCGLIRRRTTWDENCLK